ncbi:hypothetical protein [Streptomyces bicolor]|nr:hypothetical protein [Streptomyces bicolor]
MGAHGLAPLAGIDQDLGHLIDTLLSKTATTAQRTDDVTLLVLRCEEPC